MSQEALVHVVNKADNEVSVTFHGGIWTPLLYHIGGQVSLACLWFVSLVDGAAL